MPFTGDEAEQIPLNQAARWTRNYREKHPGETKAHFFGRNLVQKILDQEGCMGIRLFYALDDDSQKQLIMVGANAEANNQVDGVIADRGFPCPDQCGQTDALNSDEVKE
ncbi:MAG: hypothetical protein ICV83_01265 [Cytophagales bacterium]|nr:hypothetical protein [Cytophagales bacterium]